MFDEKKKRQILVNHDLLRVGTTEASLKTIQDFRGGAPIVPITLVPTSHMPFTLWPTAFLRASENSLLRATLVIIRSATRSTSTGRF